MITLIVTIVCRDRPTALLAQHELSVDAVMEIDGVNSVKAEWLAEKERGGE